MSTKAQARQGAQEEKRMRYLALNDLAQAVIAHAQALRERDEARDLVRRVLECVDQRGLPVEEEAEAKLREWEGKDAHEPQASGGAK